MCLEIRKRLVSRGLRVWQQKTNIPKDSENWFNEWFPSAIKARKIVCFITAAYLKSPCARTPPFVASSLPTRRVFRTADTRSACKRRYCMKEFGIALAANKLLVVACEPIAMITAVDAGEYPHASNALAYLMGGGQVIFHDTDDVEAEIMEFIPRDDPDGAEPEPEPSGELGLPPNFASPTPTAGDVTDLYEAGDIVEAMLASVRLSTYGHISQRGLRVC